MSKKPIFGNSYVPPYAYDYNKLSWYERDLMTYMTYYKKMVDNPAKYFRHKQIVNFDIIHHECGGDKLKNSYKHYKTVKQEELKNYPKKEKKWSFICFFRNIKHDDLWVQRDLMLEYFF